MSGTGGCDIGGVIPYSAIPQVYDPPSHVVATDNQRPVSASYPYYVGTSGDFYDPGYRAGFAYQSLDAAVGSGQVSAATIASLQNSVTDSLAASIVPRLLAVLRSAGPLPPAQRSAASVLGSWDYSMSADSAAATVWWTFWSDYVGEVFEPWWKAGHVPAGRDPTGLKAGPGLASLDEDLQAWTLAGPAGTGGGSAVSGGGGAAASGAPAGGGAAVTAVADATFRGPSGHGPADARAAMLAAFRQAASGLSASLGGAASSWTWGRVHARAFPSVTGAAGLGYGPRATGGDPFVEDAADGGMTASTGPSWRMVATLSAPSGGGASGGGVSAEGVYPGGQSENPASPWYDNLVSLWWDGQYLPVPEPGSAGFTGGVRWALHG
jgi:penicillin amidase